MSKLAEATNSGAVNVTSGTACPNSRPTRLSGLSRIGKLIAPDPALLSKSAKDELSLLAAASMAPDDRKSNASETLPSVLRICDSLLNTGMESPPLPAGSRRSKPPDAPDMSPRFRLPRLMPKLSPLPDLRSSCRNR